MNRPTITLEAAHDQIAAYARALVPAITVANIEAGMVGHGVYIHGAESTWDWRRTQFTLAIAMARPK